jgi:hypothetical protein
MSLLQIVLTGGRRGYYTTIFTTSRLLLMEGIQFGGTSGYTLGSTLMGRSWILKDKCLVDWLTRFVKGGQRSFMLNFLRMRIWLLVI